MVFFVPGSTDDVLVDGAEHGCREGVRHVRELAGVLPWEDEPLLGELLQAEADELADVLAGEELLVGEGLGQDGGAVDLVVELATDEVDAAVVPERAKL